MPLARTADERPPRAWSGWLTGFLPERVARSRTDPRRLYGVWQCSQEEERRQYPENAVTHRQSALASGKEYSHDRQISLHPGRMADPAGERNGNGPCGYRG